MLIIPKNYHSPYGIMDTERAIKLIKDTFETTLAKALNLTRISAPLFVRKRTGLNDNLSGVERPVTFQMKQTLSPKTLWYRNARGYLYRYECYPP